MQVTVDDWDGVWTVCEDQLKSKGMHDFTRVERKVRLRRMVGRQKQTETALVVRLAPNHLIHEWKEPIDPTVIRS